MKGVTGVVILPFENTKNEKRGIERERERESKRERKTIWRCYIFLIFFQILK